LEALRTKTHEPLTVRTVEGDFMPQGGYVVYRNAERGGMLPIVTAETLEEALQEMKDMFKGHQYEAAAFQYQSYKLQHPDGTWHIWKGGSDVFRGGVLS
jgi:predicted RNase H-like HicB family nuclease